MHGWVLLSSWIQFNHSNRMPGWQLLPVDWFVHSDIMRFVLLVCRDSNRIVGRSVKLAQSYLMSRRSWNFNIGLHCWCLLWHHWFE
jgi:hypothetical protein